MMVMLLSSPTTAPGGGKSGSKAKDFLKNVYTKKKKTTKFWGTLKP
jgi:hypothetical protein